MSNVLIRDVSPEDLDRIKGAAAQQGMTLQVYLWETVHAQAAFLRRKDALARAAERTEGRPWVSDEARQAVLDAIQAAHDERGSQLGGFPPR